PCMEALAAEQPATAAPAGIAVPYRLHLMEALRQPAMLRWASWRNPPVAMVVTGALQQVLLRRLQAKPAWLATRATSTSPTVAASRRRVRIRPVSLLSLLLATAA